MIKTTINQQQILQKIVLKLEGLETKLNLVISKTTPSRVN
jgi:hypothetical protein